MKQSSKRHLQRSYFAIRCVTIEAFFLCFIFLTPFFRDLHFDNLALAEWRRALLETFTTSFQYAWCSILMLNVVMLLTLNVSVCRLPRFDLAKLLKPQPNGYLFITQIMVFVLLIWTLVRYGQEYKIATRDMDAIVWFFCILIHQWLVFWMLNNKPENAATIRSTFVSLFLLVSFASIMMSPFNPTPNTFNHGKFVYKGHTRWTGICANPNAFGLLMAVVFIISSGRAWRAARRKQIGWSVLYVVAATVASYSLLKSYSRSAWVAALTAILFSSVCYLKSRIMASYKQPNSLPLIRFSSAAFSLLLGVVVGYFSIAGIKSAERSKFLVFQRSVSAFGQRDFSSQNRLASYQDGIIMLMDHPFAGYGWMDIIAIHKAFYLKTGLFTGEALRLNNFLVLALRLGMPMFLVFLFFLRIWLSGWSGEKAQIRKIGGDIVLCRLAVLIFFVGFFFTSGFFSLTVGGCFWLFLTLGYDFDPTRDKLAQSSFYEGIEKDTTCNII